MLLVVVVAIPCSWLATELKAARQQHESVKAIEKLGGGAVYDYEGISTAPGYAILRRWMGIDMFANVAIVFSAAHKKMANSRLEYIKELPNLQVIDLDGTDVSDSGLVNIARD